MNQKLFGFDDGKRHTSEAPTVPSRRTATPWPLGTGLAGDTCKTCRHRVRQQHNGKTYQKCGKAQKAWTHGAGSDIKVYWSACWAWNPTDTGEIAVADDKLSREEYAAGADHCRRKCDETPDPALKTYWTNRAAEYDKLAAGAQPAAKPTPTPPGDD